MNKLILLSIAMIALIIPSSALAGYTTVTYRNGDYYENTGTYSGPNYLDRTFNYIGMSGTTNGENSMVWDSYYAGCSGPTGNVHLFYATSSSRIVDDYCPSASTRMYCARGNSGSHTLLHVTCQTNYRTS